MHPTAADSLPAAQSIEHRRLSTQHDPSPTLLEELLRERRRRTILLRNVAESSRKEASARQLDDEQMVRTVLDIINIQVRAIAIYRVGKCGPKPRFLLAELPTRSHAVEVLRNGRLIKDSACQHVFVGLSMTPQERADWFRKRQQLKATAAPSPMPLTEATVPPAHQPMDAEAQPPAPSSATKRKRKPKKPRKRNMDTLALQPPDAPAQQPVPLVQQPGPSLSNTVPSFAEIFRSIDALQRVHHARTNPDSEFVSPFPPGVLDSLPPP